MAVDMADGYVEQKDLELLLPNLSKALTTTCLVNQIYYGFAQGTEIGGKEQVETCCEQMLKFVKFPSVTSDRLKAMINCHTFKP